MSLPSFFCLSSEPLKCKHFMGRDSNTLQPEGMIVHSISPHRCRKLITFTSLLHTITNLTDVICMEKRDICQLAIVTNVSVLCLKSQPLPPAARWIHVPFRFDGKQQRLLRFQRRSHFPFFPNGFVPFPVLFRNKKKGRKRLFHFGRKSLVQSISRSPSTVLTNSTEENQVR